VIQSFVDTCGYRSYFVIHPGTTTVGTQYRKSVYREYNDSSFDHAIDIPEWQGMMGPIFRGEVGDTFEIHVKNQASKNYSMHPHVCTQM
jgi:hypothetical protein